MSSLCAENHHNHHHYPYSDQYPLFNIKQELNLPPRKLLTRHSNLPIPISEDFLNENPPTPKTLQRFLLYNAEEEEDEDDDDDDDDELTHPYSTDDFRIYEFKVRRCMRSRSHDWTDCPFAHPGEKARRRDPRKFHYSGISCADFRRGSCPRGDSCEFAHGVFECWLHPARYRTQACKDGRSCRRKICFFAHTPKQLRVLPANLRRSSSSSSSSSPRHEGRNCCNICNSPTSTLMGFSHLSSSPPISPSISSPPRSPSTNEELLLSYKKKLILELVSSLEAMDLSSAAAASPTTSSIDGNLSWAAGNGVSPSYSEDQMQTQFVLSPCTSKGKASDQFKDYGNDGGSCPDLNWVNELLSS